MIALLVALWAPALGGPALIVPTPVEHPERLARVAAAAQTAKTRRVRITHFGDSHVAADLYTAVAREALQAKLGDGGRGFVRPGRPWASHHPQHVRLATTGRWRADGLRGGLGDGGEGVGGCAMAGQPPGASVQIATRRGEPGGRIEAVDIHSLAQPHGGCVEVRLDGKPTATLATHAPWVSLRVHRLDVAPGAHTLTLHPGAGEVRLLGVDLQRSAGLVYDALGINGAVATRLLEARADVFAAGLQRLAPHLVVLAYGTNEAYGADDFDPEQYALGLDRVLARVRAAAPDADCLLQGPPDFQRKRKTVPALAQVIAAQRAAADVHGCAFWDTQAAMGGPGAIARWRKAKRAQADRVHLTRDGYEQLGAAWAQALLAALTGP